MVSSKGFICVWKILEWLSSSVQDPDLLVILNALILGGRIFATRDGHRSGKHSLAYGIQSGQTQTKLPKYKNLAWTEWVWASFRWHWALSLAHKTPPRSDAGVSLSQCACITSGCHWALPPMHPLFSKVIWAHWRCTCITSRWSGHGGGGAQWYSKATWDRGVGKTPGLTESGCSGEAWFWALAHKPWTGQSLAQTLVRVQISAHPNLHLYLKRYLQLYPAIMTLLNNSLDVKSTVCWLKRI